MDKRTLKLTVIGDSTASGVGSDTYTPKYGAWKIVWQNVLTVAYFLRLLVVSGLHLGRGRPVGEVKERAYEFLDKLRSKNGTSWLVGSLPWSLPGRLERLSGARVDLTNRTRLGMSWKDVPGEMESLPSGQDVIVIQLGINDFFEGRYLKSDNAAVEVAKEICESALKPLSEKNPGAHIYVMPVVNMPYILTNAENHRTDSYRVLFGLLRRTVARMHFGFWQWQKQGNGLSTYDNRSERFFVEKYDRHLLFNAELARRCKMLADRGIKVRLVSEFFNETWFPQAKYGQVSCDSSHPGLGAHQYGAYRLSRIIAEEIFGKSRREASLKDPVAMHPHRRALGMRLGTILPKGVKTKLMPFLLLSKKARRLGLRLRGSATVYMPSAPSLKKARVKVKSHSENSLKGVARFGKLHTSKLTDSTLAGHLIEAAECALGQWIEATGGGWHATRVTANFPRPSRGTVSLDLTFFMKKGRARARVVIRDKKERKVASVTFHLEPSMDSAVPTQKFGMTALCYDLAGQAAAVGILTNVCYLPALRTSRLDIPTAHLAGKDGIVLSASAEGGQERRLYRAVEKPSQDVYTEDALGWRQETVVTAREVGFAVRDREGGVGRVSLTARRRIDYVIR